MTTWTATPPSDCRQHAAQQGCAHAHAAAPSPGTPLAARYAWLGAEHWRHHRFRRHRPHLLRVTAPTACGPSVGSGPAQLASPAWTVSPRLRQTRTLSHAPCELGSRSPDPCGSCGGLCAGRCCRHSCACRAFWSPRCESSGLAAVTTTGVPVAAVGRAPKAAVCFAMPTRLPRQRLNQSWLSRRCRAGGWIARSPCCHAHCRPAKGHHATQVPLLVARSCPPAPQRRRSCRCAHPRRVRCACCRGCAWATPRTLTVRTVTAPRQTHVQ